MPGVGPQGAPLAVLAGVREPAQRVATLHAEDVHSGQGNAASLHARKQMSWEGGLSVLSAQMAPTRLNKGN